MYEITCNRQTRQERGLKETRQRTSAGHLIGVIAHQEQKEYRGIFSQALTGEVLPNRGVGTHCGPLGSRAHINQTVSG